MTSSPALAGRLSWLVRYDVKLATFATITAWSQITGLAVAGLVAGDKLAQFTGTDAFVVQSVISMFGEIVRHYLLYIHVSIPLD